VPVTFELTILIAALCAVFGMLLMNSQFGVGTVVSVESYNDDEKITVRFLTVGQKKLLSKYARLERA
jgi:hypothetical protein